MAHGKIYRYIFIETRAKRHFFIILLMVLVSAAEIITLFFVNGKIREGEARKALIARVPGMESVLYPGTNRRPTLITKDAVKPLKIGKNRYLLKGVRELDGRLSALINDNVYQVNDVLDGYRIIKITAESVLFKNDKTGDMKILRLGN